MLHFSPADLSHASFSLLVLLPIPSIQCDHCIHLHFLETFTKSLLLSALVFTHVHATHERPIFSCIAITFDSVLSFRQPFHSCSSTMGKFNIYPVLTDIPSLPLLLLISQSQGSSLSCPLTNEGLGTS